jgi:hypothetical protein
MGGSGWTFLIGRILYGILFGAQRLDGSSGRVSAVAGLRPKQRDPLAGPAVVVSGVGIVAGGIGIAVGIWANLAALGIAVFLFFTASRRRCELVRLRRGIHRRDRTSTSSPSAPTAGCQRSATGSSI